MGSRTRGIISAGHPQTAEAAARILEEGGNAFDAAIAALLTSFSSESCMSSPGGGGFANIRTAGGQEMLIDFFCQTPLQKKKEDDLDFYPIIVDYGEKQEEFHIGLGSAAAPGTIAGLFEIHHRFGSIPMPVLGEYAIETAKHGALVDDFQHYDFLVLKNILLESSEARSIFFKDGQPVPVGETIRMEKLADFLDALVREGPDLFYKGEICRKLVSDSKSNGGSLSREDLENYAVRIAEPVSFEFAGNKITSNPLPSVGGSLLVLCLHHFSKLNEKRKSESLLEKNIAESLLYISKLDRTPAALHLELLKAGINSTYSEPDFSPFSRGTTHFNILDEHQNAISVSTSNGEGSGYMIPGTHIMLNNMLGEIALLPGGFHSWKKNVRLSSLMSPTIVLGGKNQVKAVLGSGGAGRIPGAVSQVLISLLSRGKNSEEAVHWPRMHVVGNHVHLEPGIGLDEKDFPPDMEVHKWRKGSMFFGGVHAITFQNGIMEGTGDRRRWGVSREVS